MNEISHCSNCGLVLPEHQPWCFFKRKGNGNKMKYKSLEQQIRDLWASRSLEVLEETFEAVGKNKFKWTIIAKKVETK